MYRDDSSLEAQLAELLRRVRVLETQAPVGFTAVSRGALRILSPEGLIVDGTARVSGRLDGDGTFDWTGPLFLRGNTGITGILQVTGATTLAGSLNVAGATTLNNTLTIGSGQIKAGDVTITPTGGGKVQIGSMTIDGANGGTIWGDGPIYMQGSGSSSVRVVGTMVASDVNVFGTVTTYGLEAGPGPKNFRIEHPTKPGYWLRHGSTESPVSGTEYTGRATIGDDGSVVVELPDYFEALNKPGNRTVQLTPIGKPFAVGADEVLDGQFVAYGEPGRDVFWLVKSERISGDFPVEAEMDPPADQ